MIQDTNSKINGDLPSNKKISYFQKMLDKVYTEINSRDKWRVENFVIK